MKPEDVPDELVEAFLSARVGKVTDATRTAVREILAAVLPEHEKQVRKQIVKELESAHGPLDVNDLAEGEFDEGVQAAINTVRLGGAR